jgi:excisionase family DNA binding protein
MLTVREASQLLGVSRQTVITRLRKGQLAGKKIPSPNAYGHYWLVSESEVRKGEK